MASLSVPPLLVSILASATIILSARPGCRLRFDSCAREEEKSLCAVRLHRWCNCTDDIGGCPTNETVIVKPAIARFLLIKARTGTLDHFCDRYKCSIVPGPCEWGPWKTYIDLCLMKRERRYRERCCHPTFPKVRLNITCDGKRESEVRQTMEVVEKCFSGLLYPEVKKEDETKKQDTDDDGPWSSGVILLVILGSLAIPVGLGLNMRKKKKDKRSQTTVPIASVPLQSQEQTVPKEIIFPQPGQPLPESVMPKI